MSRVHRARWKRQLLQRRQGGVCPICGTGLKLADVTLDHKMPRSKGGGSRLANLQATHALCNQIKADKIIVDLPPTKSELERLIADRLCWRPEDA